MSFIPSPNLQLNGYEQSLLYRITNQIRRTLDLAEIITVTVDEIRALLGTDRVMIYKFHPNGSGQVVAESIYENCLPSLLGLNFPADDIPPDARQLFIQSRIRSIVNLDTLQIGQIPIGDWDGGEIISQHQYYRSIEPCHVEYLKAMGVKFSLVLPILHQEELWGLLVSHHSQARLVGEHELAILQMIVDQLSMAIAQSILLTQAKQKAANEAIINRISTLLHSLPSIELGSALEETVTAFSGSGGRLCISVPFLNTDDNNISLKECLQAGNNYIKIYRDGEQPVVPELGKYSLMEQYSLWEKHYQAGDYDVWAITDIYQHSEFRSLQALFLPTKIRSLLMIPLQYRQNLLGYLSIFRDEIDTETLWAGQFDSDQRQIYPRLSFQAWKESKQAQAVPWTKVEIELAQKIGQQFALAIQQHQLYQQVNILNANLELQVQERTSNLQQALEDLKKVQTQLIQTEKMSSLGQLVAGIAHEINNPVNFIYGNISHINQYAKELLEMLELYQQQQTEINAEIQQRAKEIDLEFLVEDLPKILSSMEIGIDRIQQIVSGLRTFSRLDEAEIKAVNIHEGIDSTLLILQYRLKTKSELNQIKLVKEYGDLPLVECYAGQLNQVFMNVLINAIDALENYRESQSEFYPRQITISTAMSEMNHQKSVVIRIEDNLGYSRKYDSTNI